MGTSVHGVRHILRAALAGLVVLLGLLVSPQAQGVGVQASLSSESMSLGEAVQLQIACTGTTRAPQPPAINVEGLDIRYVGPSTQMQYSLINGQMTATQSVTHVYQVMPTRAGNFTIPAVEVEVEGQRFRTAPLRLAVAAAAPAPQGGAAPPLDRIAFAEIVLPKKTAYVGEALPTELRLYVDARIPRQLDQMPQIQGEGFTKTKLQEPRQEVARRDGREYLVYVFRTAIVPSKAGKIPIGPVEFNFIAQIPRPQRSRQDPFSGLLDGFFGDRMFAQNERRSARAEAVELDVKPLPVQGRPEDFSGAVGEYQFTAGGSPAEVKVGDPITMRLHVTGRGSFDRVAAPVMTDTTGWRSYPAAAGTFNPADDLATAGTKTFEMAVIPEQPHTTMPEFQFSYFDPAAEKYVTLKSAPIPLRVTGAAPPPPPPVPQAAASAPKPDEKKPAAPAPTDIHGLRYELGPVRESFEPLYARRSFLLAQLVPLALVLGLLGRRLFHRSEDARALAALRREKGELASRLRSESSHSSFYDAAARAIQIETALATGCAPGSVDAAAACRARALGRETAEAIAEIFNARAELLYAGQGGGDGRISAREREQVLATIAKFSASNGKTG
jgi:hypothetical protein